MNTTPRIPVGARVMYIGGGDEHNEALVGRFGTLAEDDGTLTLPYYVRFETTPTDTWWCPAEALILVPSVGDKVIPVNGDRVGIHAEYRNAVGTVTNVVPADMTSRARIVAEFRSHQKPDDTVEWSFYEWKPADIEEPITFETRNRMLGKTIKVVTSTVVPVGTITKVTAVWDYREDAYAPKVDGITVGVEWNGDTRSWVQAYEVIEDGQTLTVSQYRPSLGEQVQIDGFLDSDGITECRYVGTVIRLEGDIWTVVVDEREFVTGPGYVFPVEVPATPVEPAIITDLQNQIDELTRQLSRANDRVSELRDRAGMWERDFMRSWQRVGREATERAWCSEYEQVVDDVQETLEIGKIPPRVRLVEKRVRLRSEVYRDVTVWVEEGKSAENPENWYESDDLDDACSDEFLVNQLDEEYNENGWDETSVTVLN